MKNLLKGLNTNEKDNFLTAYAKGMVKGWGTSTMVIGSIAGTVFMVGKMIAKKDMLEQTGDKTGAE